MNSDKAIFYYFCLVIVMIMLVMALLIAITCIVTSSPPDDQGWELIKKMLIFGACFSVPPIIWKLFVKEDPKKRKTSNNGWLYLWGIIWVIIIGIASGFLKAGMIKSSMWIYIGSLFPASMGLLPLCNFFRPKEINEE